MVGSQENGGKAFRYASDQPLQPCRWQFFFFFLPAAVLFGGAIGRKSRQHLRLLEIQDNKHGGGSCEGIPRGGDTRRENIKKVISQPEAVTRKEKKT